MSSRTKSVGCCTIVAALIVIGDSDRLAAVAILLDVATTEPVERVRVAVGLQPALPHQPVHLRPIGAEDHGGRRGRNPFLRVAVDRPGSAGRSEVGCMRTACQERLLSTPPLTAGISSRTAEAARGRNARAQMGARQLPAGSGEPCHICRDSGLPSECVHTNDGNALRGPEGDQDDRQDRDG
jgi:hypothetical protein